MEQLSRPVSPLTYALIKSYTETRVVTPTGIEKIRVSRTVSAAAFIVERIRNAIELRDESQMRRAAIERILKRRILLNDRGEGVAKQILRELTWAKYLANNTVPQEKTAEVQAVIDKYLLLRQQLLAQVNSQQSSFYSSWMLEVASCEIEEKLSLTKTRDAFANFMYQHLRMTVAIKDADQTTDNVQVYLAVSRALLKSDRALLRYQLLKLLEPGFEQKNKHAASEIAPRMSNTIALIEEQIFLHIGAKLYRYARRLCPPFMILKDVFDRNSDLTSLVGDSKKLQVAVWETCATRYRQTGNRLRRLAVRSIIYIFLTKMVFALIVEIPVDQSLHGELALIPLAVNITFPILLMAFVALTNTPPGEANTARILRRIEEIIIHVPSATDHKTRFMLRETVIRPVLTFIFTLLYGITFILVFGIIVYFLNIFHFTIPSQVIFVFFLCVVTFFGYQVHQTANEYRYEEREGLFTPIFDFLFLPILRVGQWLSSEVTSGAAKFFTYIFDFFFEIPLKTVFELLEEWFSFIRSKKEELS